MDHDADPYILSLELPEVEEDEVQIEIREDLVTIRAMKRVAHETRRRWPWPPRFALARSFRLPADADPGACRGEPRGWHAHPADPSQRRVSRAGTAATKRETMSPWTTTRLLLAASALLVALASCEDRPPPTPPPPQPELARTG